MVRCEPDLGVHKVKLMFFRNPGPEAECFETVFENIVNEYGNCIVM